MAENNPTINDSGAISATLREALARLDDPTLTILGAARAAIDRALARPVDPSRIAERDAAIAEYLREVVATQRTVFDNALGTATTKLDYALGPLAAPAPRPTAIERARERLFAVGCNGALCDVVKARLRSDSEVGSITRDGIEFDGHHHTWGELIRWAQPASWTNDRAWRAQFEPLPSDSQQRPADAR